MLLSVDAGIANDSSCQQDDRELITDGACGRESSTSPACRRANQRCRTRLSTAGSFQTLIVTDALGNSTSLTDAAPGETPCFQVNASSAPRSFKAMTHLTGTTIEASHPDRGADVLMDAGGDGTGVAGVPDATPQPGDVLTLDTSATTTRSFCPRSAPRTTRPLDSFRPKLRPPAG